MTVGDQERGDEASQRREPSGPLASDDERKDPPGSGSGGAPEASAEGDSADDYAQIGRFTVLHKIASGGMGVVYAALDAQLDRKVAIKLLQARESRNEEAYGRMMREARAMARLSHPNVVQVHDVGEMDGKAFVAMEYVQGQTLRNWLKAERRSWRDVLEIFRQAGQGLMAAHSAGIVHRDFKPDNVIVGKARRVKVVDFGLARWDDPSDPGFFDDPGTSDEQPPRESFEAEDAEHSGNLTRTGFVMGTPAYMSPEQHSGFPADARSDQFSFCVALYEALYGRRPFPGRNFKQVSRTITRSDPLPAPPDSRVPRWLHQVILRGLSRDPSRRFPSMEALLDGFGDFKAKVDARNTTILRLETGLGSLWVGLYWVLDWWFVREHFLLTSLLRGTLVAYALGIYVLCRRRPRVAERYVDPLAYSVNLAGGCCFAAIAWLEGGLESPYYAGLALLVLGMGIMFLWKIRTALLINGLIYAFYVLPLVLGLVPAAQPGTILMNQFFLLSTMLIAVLGQHQRYALQRREFFAEKERSQLREEVAAMARGGRLPELHDRAQFLVLAEDEFQRSCRFDRPMTCLVMAIDNLAEVNERHGDAVGDELLEYVSVRLVKDVRQFDLVGKYHADEFVFVLPETEAADAREVSDRLIGTFAGAEVTTRAGLVPLVVSLGVSQRRADTPDLASLVGRAIAARCPVQARSEARSEAQDEAPRPSSDATELPADRVSASASGDVSVRARSPG